MDPAIPLLGIYPEDFPASNKDTCSTMFIAHSAVEGYLGSFQLLAIINRAAMNIVGHVSLLHAGESSGYMPRSGIAGSSGSDMPSFLRNHQTALNAQVFSALL